MATVGKHRQSRVAQQRSRRFCHVQRHERIAASVQQQCRSFDGGQHAALIQRRKIQQGRVGTRSAVEEHPRNERKLGGARLSGEYRTCDTFERTGAITTDRHDRGAHVRRGSTMGKIFGTCIARCCAAGQHESGQTAAQRSSRLRPPRRHPETSRSARPATTQGDRPTVRRRPQSHRSIHRQNRDPTVHSSVGPA